MSRFTEGVIALKIANRSIKRNRLQSFLIIAIIAVPVMLVSTLLTFDASTKSTSSELLKYELGAASAKYQISSAPDKNLAQTPTSLQLQFVNQNGAAPEGELVDIRTVLPKLKLISITKTEAIFKTAGGIGPVEVFAGESWNQALLNKGPVSLLAGVIPQTKNEVMVTPSALKRFGVKLGENIATNDGQTFKVVGTLRDYSTSSTSDIVFMSQDALPLPHNAVVTFYQLGGASPTWKEVLSLNKMGIGVLSRQVILNPPPIEEQPISNGSGIPFAAIFSVLLFLVPLGLLPVVVLAGSAFAFGARRQTRTLAVMSSLGASRRTLQNVTVTSGIWLGLIGGVAGVALGAIVVSLFGPAMASKSFSVQPPWNQYPGFHLPLVYLIVLIFASGVLGAVSSYLPARKASRVNILATLRGQREEGQVKARAAVGALLLLLIGLAVVVLGVLLFAYAETRPVKVMADYEARDALKKLAVYGQLAGGIVTVIGFMVGRGWILRGLRAVLSFFGKRFNFAGRDLLFNRSRYAPVLSSVLVVYFVGAMIIGVSYGPMVKQAVNSAKMQSYLVGQYNYEFPRANVTQEATPEEFIGSLPSVTTAQYTKNLISQSGGFTSVAVINSTPDYYYRANSRDANGDFLPAFDVTLPHVIFNPDAVCYYQSLSGRQEAYAKAHQKDQNSESYLNYPPGCSNVLELTRTIVVGDEDTLRVITNRNDAEAERTLKNGGVVVLNRLYDFNGTAKIRWTTESEYSMDNQFSSKNATRAEDLKSYLVPGVPSVNSRYSAIISPQTAESLGITAYPQNILANTTTPISTEVSDSLMGKGIYFDSYATQAGPDANSFAWIVTWAAGIFALLATSIALGLSQIEAAADKRTLAAIGAPKSFRARMVATQAFALTFTGAILGGGVGLAVGLTLVMSSNISNFVLAIPQLVTLFLGVPLLSAFVFWVFTPRKLNFEIRQALD